MESDTLLFNSSSVLRYQFDFDFAFQWDVDGSHQLRNCSLFVPSLVFAYMVFDWQAKIEVICRMQTNIKVIEEWAITLVAQSHLAWVESDLLKLSFSPQIESNIRKPIKFQFSEFFYFSKFLMFNLVWVKSNLA